MKHKKWYKLNNMGKFYASFKNTKISRVFRYSAILYDDIDEHILQVSLNKTIEIFPNFNVNLKRGLFWYYLDETNKVNEVTKENLPICFKLYKNSDDFLYRVSYYKRKINLEISHILSDGMGSIEFFKLLLTNYINIKYNTNIDTTKNNASALEKVEDSFDKYYQKPKLPKTKKLKTYSYESKKYRNQTRFMECRMNVKDVLKIAHEYNTTLTGLLVSVLIYSFKDEMKLSDMNKYITIDIPVDLRNYFKSSSSMNFFGLANVSYKFNSKSDTLEDIIKEVNKQFKKNLKIEKIIERVNLMVSFEKNWFCKIVPIFLKDMIINAIDRFAVQKNTSCLSNLGIIQLDEKIEKEIESISVLTSTRDFTFTCCTLKETLCIGISSCYENNDVIKNFCRYFSNNNIMVKVDVSEVE